MMHKIMSLILTVKMLVGEPVYMTIHIKVNELSLRIMLLSGRKQIYKWNYFLRERTKYFSSWSIPSSFGGFLA